MFLVVCSCEKKMLLLTEACLNGDVNVVRILLDNGHIVHAKNDEALKKAAGQGRFDVVKLLLERNADVHADNEEALCNAACSGHLDVVTLLLDSGANVHVEKDKPLFCAVYFMQHAVVRLLLDRCANVHLVKLHHVAVYGNRDMVGLLVSRGARLLLSMTKIWPYSQKEQETMLATLSPFVPVADIFLFACLHNFHHETFDI